MAAASTPHGILATRRSDDGDTLRQRDPGLVLRLQLHAGLTTNEIRDASNTSPASTPSPAPPTCGPCWNDPRPAIKRPNSPSPSTSTGSSQGSLPWPPPAPASTRSCSAAARARAPDPSACRRRPPLPRSVDRRPGQRQSHESLVSSPATSESESSSSVLGKIWRSPRLSVPTLESVGPADALLRRARGGRPGRW